MTEPLSADKRKMVAEACPTLPEPYVRNIDFRSLVTGAARLIEELPYEFGNADRLRFMRRFNTAVAAGDINAIESLCADLLEKKDGN
jgi:hypothetical protein